MSITKLVKADNHNDNDKQVAITFRPDDIVNSFKTIVSSDYIKMLANEFATAAAERFITELRMSKVNGKTYLRDHLLINTYNKETQAHNSKDVEADPLPMKSEGDNEEWIKNHEHKSSNTDIHKDIQQEPVTETDKPPILNEEQALTLLNEPASDGDYLGEPLTDAEDATSKPVFGEMKINGVYFRRLLEMI